MIICLVEMFAKLVESIRKQERHEQQLKGLNSGRARGREDVADRSRKVSDAIEKAMEDAAGSIMQRQQQQQQQRRGRTIQGGHQPLTLIERFGAFVRRLDRNFARDLKRHPIRLRQALVSFYILFHCLVYSCLFIFARLDLDYRPYRLYTLLRSV